MTTATQTEKRWRRGRPRPQSVQRPDLPYTTKLSDGRTLFIEVPGRMVTTDRGGEIGFTPEGGRFLDRARALAMSSDTPPRPAYITTVREAMGMTQEEFGGKLGVDKLTVSRWERGAMRPGPASLQSLRKLVERAKKTGVVLPG